MEYPGDRTRGTASEDSKQTPQRTSEHRLGQRQDILVF